MTASASQEETVFLFHLLNDCLSMDFSTDSCKLNDFICSEDLTYRSHGSLLLKYFQSSRKMKEL